MNRRLPLVILSVAALVVLPSTAATATGGGHHGSGKPGYSTGYKPAPGKPSPGKPKPGKPTPAPQPTAAPGALCGGKRTGDVIPWNAYTCDQATGYFLYKKLDVNKAAAYRNSGPQHRVALHTVWAWPTADTSVRTEASWSLPRNAQIIPLELDATDTAAVCAERDAYGLQVDLVGDGEAGRGLDVPSLVPTAITPSGDGGFPVPNTLAFYGHYDVNDLVDLDVLCAPVVVPTPSASPTPPPSPSPTPSPTPTADVDDVDDEPTVAPTPTPAPSPSETSEVLPAPAETPTPSASATATPTPTPTPTERAEVLAAVEDDTLAATGTQAAFGLLAAIGAIAGGTALVLARRRHRTES